MEEKWKPGNTVECVVSNICSRQNANDHHVDYYGGYLVAESIPKKEYVNLIAAAPELLEALQELVAISVRYSPIALHPSKLFCRNCGLNAGDRIHFPGCPVSAAENAIAKATGQPIEDRLQRAIDNTLD